MEARRVGTRTSDKSGIHRCRRRLYIQAFEVDRWPRASLRSGEYLFEIIMRRHELKSTIMTSNRPLEDWGKLIGDVPTATAILDRLLDGAEIIQITGKSYRIGRRRGKSEE